MDDLNQLYDAVLAGDHSRARAIAELALASGVEPLRLVNEFMSMAAGS